MILYFSGTGNSRYTAEYLAQLTEDEFVCINDFFKENKSHMTFQSSKPFVFVTPVYAWRIPKIVSNFIKSCHFTGSHKAYFAVTCGDSIGNADKYVRILCKEKNFHHMGTAQILMPENYLVLFHTPDQKTADHIINNAAYPIEKLADSINTESTLAPVPVSWKGKIESGLINHLFYQFFVSARGFRTTDQCTSCGLCARVCPLNNISLKDGQPIWGNKCTHCMACICRCPVEAIEYKKVSEGRRRIFNNKKVTL